MATISYLPRLLTPLKYHVFENIMENGAFAFFQNTLKRIPKLIYFFEIFYVV